MLICKGVSEIDRKLIINLITSRHSRYLESWTTGTPQGSVISSILFTGTIDQILRKLQQLGYHVVAYADDVGLIVEKCKASQAIKDAQKLFDEIGLHISESKCQILSVANKIEFLG